MNTLSLQGTKATDLIVESVELVIKVSESLGCHAQEVSSAT